MKNRLLTILLAFLPLMTWGQGTIDPEPYVVLTDSNTVMTFYYDGQKEARSATGVTLDLDAAGNPWYDYRQEVTSVVFDATFGAYRPQSTNHWFDEFTNMNTIVGMQNLNTSEVTDMGWMFRLCQSVKSIDVSGWNTENVTDMGGLFYGCQSLESVDVSGFNTSKVVNMENMFGNCYALTSVDVSNFNTSNVTNMDYMFGCTAIKNLDLTSFNTENVTNLRWMFSGYGVNSVLETIDLSTFTTGKVTNMEGMFAFNPQLSTVYVGSGWTTGAVTLGDSTFEGCTSLVGGMGTVYDTNHIDYTYAHIDGGESNPGYFTEKTSYENGDLFTAETIEGVTLTFRVDDNVNMICRVASHERESYMDVTTNGTVTIPAKVKGYTVTRIDEGAFKNCSGVTEFVLPNTLKAIEIEAFSKCTSLTTVNIPVSLTDIKMNPHPWTGCAGLTTITVDPDNTVFDSRDSCNAIMVKANNSLRVGCKTTTIPETTAIIDHSSFDGMGELPPLVIPASVQNIVAYAFWECTYPSVTSYIEEPFETSCIWDHLSDGCILYVPAGKVDAYKAVSEWSNFQKIYEIGYVEPSDTVATPYYNVENEKLVLKCDTEGSQIHYAMVNPESIGSADNLDALLNQLTVTTDSATYNDPFDMNRNIVIKYMAVKEGMENSATVSYVYDHYAWSRVFEAVVYGTDVYERAKDNERVDSTLLQQLEYMLFEGKHFYDERGYMEREMAYNIVAAIDDLCAQIEAQMNVVVEPEPYVVLTDSNTVLTFYYDGQKADRNGMDVGTFEYLESVAWKDYRESISSVVFDSTFVNCTTLSSVANWFAYCSNLTTISGLEYLKTDNVTDMNHMFYRCSSLTGLELSGFNTEKITNMNSLFEGCSGLTSLDLSAFNTANVTNMSWMFEGCSSLTSLDVSGFNTVNVTDMRHMFWGCSGLTSLDVTGFSTANVTDMGSMFTGCSGLTSLNVSGFKTANVTDMSYMFYNCFGLTNLDLSSFNTANVTSMSRMFEGCYGLKTIFVGNDWNTASVTESNEMFSGCTNLVGGMGTVYDANHTDHTYAHVDGGTANPGYFTLSGDSPYVPVDVTFDSNGVLTVGGTATMAEALAAVGGANEVAETITAIVWNSTAALTNSDLQDLHNPNMLIYVEVDTLAPVNRDNVIVGDLAKNIVLTDVSEGNGNFYCPMEFKAEMITYTHDYNQTTEVGVARGWETIALPFDVQTIMHEKQGLIAPFGNSTSGKHFWLRQPTENGLASATIIEANTAYLISMPNSDAYSAEFNLNGHVTFSSQNVWVPKTMINGVDFHTKDNTLVVLLPNFQRQASDDMIYALNVGEQRGNYPEGSVFEREYRAVRPFEAYTIHMGGPAPQFISFFDMNGGMTGIESLTPSRSEGDGAWYTIDGRKLQTKPTQKGVYILNGRKAVVK